VTANSLGEYEPMNTRLIEFTTIWKPRILIAVMGAAFVLSYVALYETATAAKYHWSMALGWPLLLDGVVLFAVISLVERQHQRLGTFTPWSVLILFDAASITLNAAYGWAISWQAVIIHALPALVLPLMMKLYTNDVKDAEAAKEAAQQAAKVAKVAQRQTARTAANGEKTPFGPQNLPAANDAKQARIDDRRALVADLARQGLTQADIGTRLKAAGHAASPDTVRRDLAALGLSDGPEVVDILRAVVSDLAVVTNGRQIPGGGKGGDHASD
jgi:hypothetical protein